MKQLFKIYETLKTAKKDVDEQAADGWFVHAMTVVETSAVFLTHEVGKGKMLPHVCIVYRKEE